MSLFLLVFLHYIASMLGILVGISAAILFYVTQRLEQAMKTFWRGLGFALIALAFFLFILERKFPAFELAAVVVEMIGFIAIFLGVLYEPGLQKLRTVKKSFAKGDYTFTKKKGVQIKKVTLYLRIISGILLVIIVLQGLVLLRGYLVEQTSFGPYVASIIEAISSLFILGTIFLQIRRYLSEKGNSENRLQNLYPLIGYIFLLFRGIFLVLYRLPESDVVFLRSLENLFSFPWRAAVFLTLGAFLFLGIWVWAFIKPRYYLRIIVSFIGVALMVSTLGALVFTLLIFTIVERDNLKLMTEGAKTQELVMDDRANTALVLARSFAADPDIVGQIATDDYFSILKPI